MEKRKGPLWRLAWLLTRRPRSVVLLAVLLLVPSLYGMVSTRVSYDILSYLPQELDSSRGQQVLEDTFQSAATTMLLVEGMPQRQVVELKGQIEQVPTVKDVTWVSDLLDITYPKQMLPEEIRRIFYSDSAQDSTMLIIRFTHPGASAETMEAIDRIRSIADERCFLAGVSVFLKDTKDLVESELPKYTLLAVVFSILAMSLTMESVVLPWVYILGIGFAILYNFGTNLLLGEVSYLTKAIAAILQLGVSMDYSIFLVDRYNEEKANFPDKRDAMASAVVSAFTSLAGSSLTTIAGFLALCAMQLGLGRDLGLVMAKGIVIGILVVLLVLPSLVLLFDPLIQHFVIVDDTLPAYQLLEMEEQMKAVDGVETLLAYNQFVGPGIPDSFLPKQVQELCKQDGLQMMMINSAYKAASPEADAQIDQLNAILKQYDPNGLITGEGVMTKDLSEITTVDIQVTNWLSVAAIFAIVAICFKSLTLPVLLVSSIELAIFINEAIPAAAGTVIPFISPIVIGCIQLGATVDYAILMTTRFQEELRGGLPREQAIQAAANAADGSIITSALVFFCANMGVAAISRIEIIKSLCGMLARGAVISALVSLFILPSVLCTFEGLVARTSIGWRSKQPAKSTANEGGKPV